MRRRHWIVFTSQRSHSCDLPEIAGRWSDAAVGGNETDGSSRTEHGQQTSKRLGVASRPVPWWQEEDKFTLAAHISRAHRRLAADRARRDRELAAAADEQLSFAVAAVPGAGAGADAAGTAVSTSHAPGAGSAA